MKLSTELLGRESGFPNDAKMSQPFARLRVPGGAKAPICGAVSNGRSRLVRSSATHPPNGVVLIGALAAGVAHPSPLTSPARWILHKFSATSKSIGARNNAHCPAVYIQPLSVHVRGTSCAITGPDGMP
jgi:hypothetical protein